MKALRFENQKLQLAEISKPSADDEAIVRVTTAGICNTDLEVVRGYANFSGTLGHEFVGVVESSPDSSMLGVRVVGEINAGCGHCDLCRANDPRHCLQRSVLGIIRRDGAFAEYVKLPAKNLLRVPDSVSDHEAVFTEPLAAACEILDQVNITSQHRVAVIGDGKLGQLIARVLATTGCDLTLIGKHQDKLKLAADAGIATIERDKISIDPTQKFHFVVEASGSAPGLNMALDLVQSRGSIILKSTFHGKVELDTSRIVVNEISVIGSRCGRFEKALALLEAKKINFTPLIAAEYSLENGVAAMQHAGRSGTLKVLIRI